MLRGVADRSGAVAHIYMETAPGSEVFRYRGIGSEGLESYIRLMEQAGHKVVVCKRKARAGQGNVATIDQLKL